MGIKGLNKIIKGQNPDAYYVSDYTQFAGKTLAMDVSIFLHKYVHTDRNTWFTSMVIFFAKMKKANITIIAVFDGKNVPIEKYLERDNRKVNSEKLQLKLKLIDQAQEMIYTHYISDFDDYSPPLTEDHQLHVRSLVREEVDFSNAAECIRALAKTYDKIANQCERVGPKHTEQTMRLVDALGISRVTAYGEAEALCAALAIHGVADGVLSRDTDTLVYGTPLFVCEFKENKFTWTTLEMVLASLQFTMEEFIDFCIMCGCDYNTNIPRVGGVTAYKYMQLHSSIEEIEKCENVDTLCLRYKRCREIFQPYSKEYIDGFQITKQHTPNKEEVLSVFAVNKCRVGYGYIEDAWTQPTIELDFLSESE